MLEANLIDKIIKEPLGGAHYDRELTFNTVKKELVSSFIKLYKLDSDKLIQLRREKFSKMGSFYG
jgi:acetyl-CoA carboxylase carboxyl transferase subunit alpha